MKIIVKSQNFQNNFNDNDTKMENLKLLNGKYKETDKTL